MAILTKKLLTFFSRFDQLKVVTLILGGGVIVLPVVVFPWSEEPYTVLKWGFIYLCGFFFILFQFLFPARKKRKERLAIPKSLIVILLVLCGLTAVTAIENGLRPIAQPYLNQFVFLVTVVGFAKYFKQKKNLSKQVSTPIKISTIITILVGLLWNFNSDLILWLPQNREYDSRLSSFFGHVNLVSEFLALSLIFQLSELSGKARSRRPLVDYILIIATVIYLIICWSLSVLLGLIGAFFVFFFFDQISRLKRFQARSLCIGSFFILAIVPGLGYWFSDYILTHVENLNFRWVLWGGTLKMIEDYPLGIGPGKFEFKSIPYNKSIYSESYLTKTPHSEYLRWICEDGILYFGVLGILFFSLLFKFLRSQSERREKKVVLSVVVFLLVHSLFSSPFTNPVPFFIFSIVVAVMLSHVSKLEKSKKNKWVIAPISVISLIYVLFSSSIFMYSKFLSSERMKDSETLSWLCHHYPENWRNCIRSADVGHVIQDYPTAMSSLRVAIKTDPYNVVAIYRWAMIAMERGRLKEGCLARWRYLNILYDLGSESNWNNTDKRCHVSRIVRIFSNDSDGSKFYRIVDSIPLMVYEGYLTKFIGTTKVKKISDAR